MKQCPAATVPRSRRRDFEGGCWPGTCTLGVEMFRRGRGFTLVELLIVVAIAVSSYGTDFIFVPKLASGTVAQLTPCLVPTYLRTLPTNDGWQRALIE